MKRNPNRGVVLSLADAHAICRWLEFVMDDNRFFNPLVAMDTERSARMAKERLLQKLATISYEHSQYDEATDPAGSKG